MKRTYKFTLLRTDGSSQTYVSDTRPNFKELYPLINTDMIEIVGCYKDNKTKTMLIDEEGRLKNNPVINPKATKFFVDWLDKENRATPIPNIVGNAIVCENFKVL
tara:strand:+ start:34 stop:348 length:315 start_codon:yes stop_codon:yes gene_type:complete